VLAPARDGCRGICALGGSQVFGRGVPSPARRSSVCVGGRSARGSVVALTAARCDGGRTPVSPSAAPPVTSPAPTVTAAPVARLSVQVPDDLGGKTVLVGLTAVTFDASTSSGADLRYRIDFGDGTFATAPNVTHVYPGTYKGGDATATLTVTDRLGESSSTTVKVRVTQLSDGFYYWTQAAPKVGERWFRFRQNADGLTLDGYYFGPENRLPGNAYTRMHLTGALSGVRSIQLISDDGSIRMSGELRLGDAVAWGSIIRMTFRGGSADGQTIDFKYADPY